ncbi:MAG: competence/damage-inducible protein A [Lachnospiraceae bacterium]|nr:competence/damage-inducible protein A [Lachnospiraceae bacterium]
MIVELISVGTELLLGNIVNTNAAFLAEQCAALGLSCFYQTVVGDNAERLCETIEKALERSDVLILSGGLGPTQDDITRDMVAKVLGKDLVLDEHSKERIRLFFAGRGQSIPDNNWRQAYKPDGAVVIDNENGTAPGLILSEKGKHIFLLPGPPNELKPMFTEQMMPYLQKLEEAVIFSVTVKLCGIGESQAETDILDLLEGQTNPTMAPYAKTGEVHLRVTAKAVTEGEARRLVQPMVEELKNRFGHKVYTTQEEVTLEQAVAELVRERGWKLATAESCTGGMLAARLTRVPGVSAVFETGLVTYANETKSALLGVKEDTLSAFGAVSPETAREMAEGLAERGGAEVALSITGIAGPDGGSADKPVGLVYIGCRVKDKTVVKECRFGGSREKIRESSVAAALTLARSCILKEKGEK